MLKESIDLHRQGRLDEAERSYRQHLAEQPDDADALHLLGLLRHQRGDPAEAENLLSRAHALAPDQAGIELSLGTLCFRAGEFDAARRHYEKTLAMDPNVAPAHSGLGQLAVLRGERDVAERHFRTALRAGEDVQALGGLGGILLERGDMDAALRHLGRAADLAPNDPMIQLSLGRAFAKRGTTSFAERAFENALRFQPNLHVARQLLGGLTLKDKRPREAEVHFSALLGIPEFAASGYVGLGDVARAEERDEEAVANYRSALAIDPVQSMPARALAWSLMRVGRRDEAIAAYDEYLALVPDDHDVRIARADLLMLIGRLPEAASDWRALAQHNPGDLQAHSRLALIEEHLGRPQVADAEAELVLRARPEDPEMLLVRIRTLLRDRDDNGARRLLDQMSQRPLTEGQARLRWNYLGRVHDRAGEAADAARCFAEAQRDSPVAMPPLEAPRSELDAALAEPVGAPWPQAPVLLLGTPGSGVERVAALLADQPQLLVLRDRIGAIERNDDFNQPRFAYYSGELPQTDREALRERYLAPLRVAGVALDRTVVDWLPRWDAHLLALVRRAMPGARMVIVERDPRDALLNWLAFGWARGFPCADAIVAATWLRRARSHLHHATSLEQPARLVVAADALLDDPLLHGSELARFVGIEALQPGPQLASMAQGLGGLPVRFPAGHWEGYRDALAEPFALLES